MVRSDRRKADAAIAHQHRRHAVARRRQDVLRPGNLRVVMSVNVDKPGDYDTTLRIDFVPSDRRNRADLRNHAIGNRYVRRPRRPTGPIDYRPVANYQIESITHGPTLLLSHNSKACVYSRTSVNLASFEELSPCRTDFL